MNIWAPTRATAADTRDDEHRSGSVPPASATPADDGVDAAAGTAHAPGALRRSRATIGTGGRVFGLCGATLPVREVRDVSGGLSWGGPDNE